MNPGAIKAIILVSSLALTGGVVYVVVDPSSTELAERSAGTTPASSSVACIDTSGRIVWVEGACPSGTRQIPNACDAGCCEPCPPEGCPPETVEALMCCPPICGEGSECFPIVATTAECPPGSVLYECDHGITLPDGSSDCYDTPPGS